MRVSNAFININPSSHSVIFFAYFQTCKQVKITKEIRYSLLLNLTDFSEGNISGLFKTIILVKLNVNYQIII